MTGVREAVSTTVTFLGPDDPDHLDPAGLYTIRTGQLLRLVSRRLFGYPAATECADAAAAFVPTPDVATAEPTVANGGLSADRRTYRFELRPGVLWDAQRAREVTAADFIRGLKRVAYSPSLRHYLTETIGGMREYCQAYDAVRDDLPTGPDLAQFQASHQVSGLSAPDPRTLVIRLVEPANDFLHILATGIASAAPREYDYYVPDNYELYRNCPSAGPYRVAGPYRIGRGALALGDEIALEPNPRWDPDSDPIRRRTVDLIRVGPGTSGNGHGHDLAWPFGTVSWEAVGEAGQVSPVGHCFGPYLVVNLRESRGAAPTSQPSVRRAISDALDRAAIRDVLTAAAPGATATVQHGVLLPGAPGYAAVSGRRSGPDAVRRVLSDAGFPGGVTLTLVVRDTEVDRQIAAALRENLAAYGIALDVLAVPAGRFTGTLRAPATSWELALTSWAPQWQGNNGRTAVVPLLRGGFGDQAAPGVANDGAYRNPVVDRLLAEALRKGDPADAAAVWRRVDEVVTEELPIIPILAHAYGPCTASAGAAPMVRWMPTT